MVVGFIRIVVGLGFFALLSSAGASLFPKPSAIEPNVVFWKRVFAEFSENQAVFHDDTYVDKIFSVIELPALPKDGKGEGPIRARRQELVKAERARLERVLRGLDRGAARTAEEKKLAKLYENFRGSSRYAAAAGRMRVQTGVKERFRRGIEIGHQFFPAMEAIFRAEGVPTELTRLPLIESSFQLRAYSKVGAAGVWQFMPESGRIYGLRMDEIVDERLDPLRAARAAARHLKADYKMLQSWPLAVTAYNHGRNGVARAIREVGSSDIGRIVERYKGRRFGFASRNFYAELVAALEIEKDAETHFPNLSYESPLQFEEIELDDYVPLRTVARLAEIDIPGLQDLNPAFTKEVVEGKLYVPPRYTIRVPMGRATPFEMAYARLGRGERFASQREYWIHHRVASGDNVGAIARRYGSSVRAIQVANSMSDPHRIRIGQVLKIPPRGHPGDAPAGPSPSRPPVAVAAAAKGVVHVVQSGDTLGAIARRYETSAASIQKVNGISDPRRLRIGQKLRIGDDGAATGSGFLLHQVRRGQTVEAIARRYGTTIRAIEAANDLPSADQIREGQFLKIPSG